MSMSKSTRGVAFTSACVALVGLQGCGGAQKDALSDDPVAAEYARVLQEVVNESGRDLMDQVQKKMNGIDEKTKEENLEQTIAQVMQSEEVKAKAKELGELLVDVQEQINEQTMDKEKALQVLDESSVIDFVTSTSQVCGTDLESKCVHIFKKIVSALKTLNEEKLGRSPLRSSDLAALAKLSDSIPGSYFTTNWWAYGIENHGEMLSYANTSKIDGSGQETYPNADAVYGYLSTKVRSVSVDGVRSVSREVCGKNLDFLNAVRQLPLRPGAFQHHSRIQQFVKSQAELLSLPLSDKEGGTLRKVAPQPKL